MMSTSTTDLPPRLAIHDEVSHQYRKLIARIEKEARLDGNRNPVVLLLDMSDCEAACVHTRFRHYEGETDVSEGDFTLLAVSLELALKLLPINDYWPRSILEPCEPGECLLAVVADRNVSIGRFSRRIDRLANADHGLAQMTTTYKLY